MKSFSIPKIKNSIKRLVNKFQKRKLDFYFRQKGFCPCCEKQVNFIAYNNWLRDHFKCENCKSIPRERALMITIENEYPNWKDLVIHESSPGMRGHSIKLKRQAKFYLETQYFSGKSLGEIVKEIRNENLENLTFKNESFDLVITSDVMEHVYDPEKVFKEIHRTLKPGGAHIFSVPLINKHSPSQRWANKNPDGSPEFLFSPEWHGNPIDVKGSPVTMHWGYDIIEKIKEFTGAESKIIYIDDLSHGIRAEYIEIIVTKKKSEE